MLGRLHGAADDLSDISLLEASLSTNQVGTGGANVFLRGVGNEIIGVGTDSSVAIYLDGVYLPRFTTALEEQQGRKSSSLRSLPSSKR